MGSGGESGKSETDGSPLRESGFDSMGDDFKDSFTLAEGSEICSFSIEMSISQPKSWPFEGNAILRLREIPVFAQLKRRTEKRRGNMCTIRPD